MSKIILALLMMSGYLFASGGAEGGEGTDIVQRTVNFLIFAGILYYLLAEPIKNYFGGRSKDIANDLERVQERLRESKRAKEEALQKIEDAKKFAEELKVTSAKENKLLEAKLVEQCDIELENLAKQNLALMEFEKRQMTRGIVDAMMRDLLEQESGSFDKETMAKIIMKKVA